MPLSKFQLGKTSEAGKGSAGEDNYAGENNFAGEDNLTGGIEMIDDFNEAATFQKLPQFRMSDLRQKF